MDNFLIGVELDQATGNYMASFFDGQVAVLMATNYHDAVLEADMLEPTNHELGYN